MSKRSCASSVLRRPSSAPGSAPARRVQRRLRSCRARAASASVTVSSSSGVRVDRAAAADGDSRPRVRRVRPGARVSVGARPIVSTASRARAPLASVLGRRWRSPPGDESATALARPPARSPPAPPGSPATRDRPGREPSAVARTARRTIFALRVFGSAATNRTRVGRERLAELAGRSARISRGQLVARLVRPGRGTQKTHATSPFTSCGHADRGRLGDGGVRRRRPTRARPGPMRLPAMFSVSSERPCRNQ